VVIEVIVKSVVVASLAMELVVVASVVEVDVLRSVVVKLACHSQGSCGGLYPHFSDVTRLLSSSGQRAFSQPLVKAGGGLLHDTASCTTTYRSSRNRICHLGSIHYMIGHPQSKLLAQQWSWKSY